MTVISGGSVVAFSAVRSNDAENLHGPGKDSEDPESKPLGTPMMMQVSLVTTRIRPMSGSEFQRAMEVINNAKDSIKGVFGKAKDFYERNEKTFTRIKRGFTALQGLGSIWSGWKKLRPEEEDPMVKNLADLTTDVKALSDKLTDNFAEMKNFISEQSFFTDIMNPTTVLTMHMIDCLAYPGDDSKRNFLMAYENMSPLKMQIHLNAYLQQTTTNPMKLAMDLEKVKTKDTFEKWEDIYCTIMAQFVVLEAFADGLKGTKSEANFDRLTELSVEVLDGIQELMKEYGDASWEDLKKFLKPFLEERQNWRNFERTRDLKEKLESYLTADDFYICMFDGCKWNEEYIYTCPDANEQLCVAWNDNCICVVYRSRTAYKKTEADYNDLKFRVYGATEKYSWPGSLENSLVQQLENRLPKSMRLFIILIHRSKYPQFQHVSHSGSPNVKRYGCGVFDDVTYDHDANKNYPILVCFE